jgi:hypothetical protein
LQIQRWMTMPNTKSGQRSLAEEKIRHGHTRLGSSETCVRVSAPTPHWSSCLLTCSWISAHTPCWISFDSFVVYSNRSLEKLWAKGLAPTPESVSLHERRSSISIEGPGSPMQESPGAKVPSCCAKFMSRDQSLTVLDQAAPVHALQQRTHMALCPSCGQGQGQLGSTPRYRFLTRDCHF